MKKVTLLTLVCLFFGVLLPNFFQVKAVEKQCGQIYYSNPANPQATTDTCTPECGAQRFETQDSSNYEAWCCGNVRRNESGTFACFSSAPEENNRGDESSRGLEGGSNDLSDFDGVTEGLLNDLNPLRIGLESNTTACQASPDSPECEADSEALFAQLSTPGGILSRVIFFAFPLAGLILFVMIVWGGFEMLSGSATKKSMDAGKQRITAALIGFTLLFVSFWIVQIVETVFGVTIFF